MENVGAVMVATVGDKRTCRSAPDAQGKGSIGLPSFPPHAPTPASTPRAKPQRHCRERVIGDPPHSKYTITGPTQVPGGRAQVVAITKSSPLEGRRPSARTAK